MPTAQVSKSSRECQFDFPGVRIGCVEYPEGPTGCTVIDLPPDSLVTVDIRGGSPAVWMGLDGDVNAITFAGGSLYGLEAVSGVTHAIRESWGPATFPLGPSGIPVVRGAAIFDFRLGHDNEIAPDRALGEFAYRNAQAGRVPLGPVGAGRSASVGKLGDMQHVTLESGGQGAGYGTFTVGTTEFKVLVLVVVNSLGGIVNRQGQVVRGHLDTATGQHLSSNAVLAREPDGGFPDSGNTTLSMVVTNCWLPDFYIRQAARQIHTSMARALDPFHSEKDGDVLYMVRAATLATTDWSLATKRLANLGSELMWESILNCWQ